ncbi:MAG TPA: hypothetical protein VHT96_10430 [Clostridia bacterium]|nr:hypothetical protein [Clostridia bacterium]
MKKTSAILLSIILMLSAAIPSSAAAGTNIGRTADDGTTYISDEHTGIRTEVSSETLDEGAYAFLRGYFNDYSLTEDQLFSRFFELKKNYIRALENLYNVNYLSNSKKKSETALRIFYEGSDTLYGVDGCGVYLYNISVYEGTKNVEESHLDLIIPVRGKDTIEMIRFIIPRESLGTNAASYVAYVLSEIGIDGAGVQNRAPSILYSDSLTEDAKLGIYPSEYQKDPIYISFENQSAGYEVHLPYTYIPYVRNSLGGDFSYDSFKISPNLIFSISSEPISGNGAEDAIARFHVTSLTSVKMLETGSRYIGNNSFNHIYYTNIENGIKKYYYDYYIQNKHRLYKLQLSSSYTEPGKNIMSQLENILEGFNYVIPSAGGKITFQNDIPMRKYLNAEEGYSFEYPENWQLEDISPSISQDRLRLVVPGMSGALDVTFQESGIIDSANFTDIIKSVEGNSISSWPDITIGYKPPFEGKISRLLLSDFSIDGPVSTIYRLSAFVDDSGRNRLCYSVDILKGRKIYSMFITSAEYRTENGYFNDAAINNLLDKSASSFRLENTPESQDRAAAGETRNRKLVFVEKYLKEKIDPRLRITSVGSIQPDNTMFVAAENTDDDGYYRVWLDYPAGRIELIDRILKSYILRGEADRLQQQYKGKKIISVDSDESNMLITIKYKDQNYPVELSHVYLVKVTQDSSKLSYETERIANREDYVNECGLYVKSNFSSDTNVYVYGENTFKDLDIFRQKQIRYRVLTYEQTGNTSGFMLVSMNPVTSIFNQEGRFIPMDNIVREIEDRYGINVVIPGNGYKFDTETFTLTLSVSGGPNGKAGTRQFRVFYDMDNGFIDFEPASINSPQQEMRR